MTLPFPFEQAGPAARLTLEFTLVGLGWAWLLRDAWSALSPGRRSLVLLGVSTLASLLGVLGVVYGLAALGRYSERNEAMALVALAASGGAAALWGAGGRTPSPEPAWRTFGVGLLLVFAALWIALVLPRRGEWVAGGWDPGLYMNQGMHVARTGTFSIPESPYFRLPGAEDVRRLFRYDRDNRRQTMPGVLVDDANGRADFQFFRLMPSFIAAVERSGGPVAAVRINHVGAVFAVVMMAALAAYLGSMRRVIVAGVVLALQPILLWHTHVPVSEMLQLVLILGALLAAVVPATGVSSLLVAGCFLAAMLNRVSFMSFGFIFLACLAVYDWDGRFCRGRLARHLLIAGALVTGMAVDLITLPVTVMGVSDAHLGMALAPLVVLPAVVFVDWAPRWAWARDLVAAWGDRFRKGVLWGWVALIPFLAWVPGLLHNLYPKVEPGNLAKLVAYVGVGAALLGWVGVVLAWRRQGRRALAFCVAFLALCAAMLIFRKYIESIYPWATRRFLDLVPPLVALGASETVDVVCGWGIWRDRRWVAALVACLMVAGAWVPSLARIRAAWANTEYDGAMAALARVADAVPDRGVVVSDHFLWGTPLQFVCGKPVLVSVCPRDTPPPAHYGRVLAQAAAATTGPLFLLTSTGDDVVGSGLDGFTVRPMLDLPWTTAEAVHNRNPNPFYTKAKAVRFRLYQITPAPQAP